ncbi:MAG: hypothetical protein IPF68_17800 [Bacteroidales bacterium]|nr:hypothetical protein [Bacteroidales bacterium]
MRKLLNKMLRMLPLLALVLSFSITHAQRPYAPSAEEDFLITLQNMVQPAGTTNILEFDIYIVDTDPSQDLQMATFQAGINFNLSILNGQAVTATMTTVVAGSSGLPTAMAPISVSTTAAGLIRIAGRAAPGCGGGFIIPTTAPGVKVGTFRMTNGNGTAFAPCSFPNFGFTSSAAITPSYATRFAYYAAATCLNTQATITPGVNANVLENSQLNCSCTPPAVFAVTGGGSYCEGGVGIPVGLSGSQVGVNYAILPGTLVVPGDGNPITFGNQLAGSYTVVATSNGTNPSICPDPVNMTGGADVTATPLVVSTVTVFVDANPVCAGTNVAFLASPVNGGDEPMYEWFVNGISQGIPSFTNTFNFVPVNGDEVYVVMYPDQTCPDGNPVSDVITMSVTPLSTVEFTDAACDTYTWALNGATYTVSGDYTYVVGCVTNILHLTITPSSTVEFTDAACDTYTWALNGATYTVSGDYTYVVGCVTNILHLTITPSGNNEYTESACDSYFWAVSGLTYTASGDYTFVNGCSTNILHLTITPSSTVEFTDAACDTYTWALNGMTYTASGDYNYVVGCVTNVSAPDHHPKQHCRSYRSRL